MTPDSMAQIHAAAFIQSRPWSAQEIAALCSSAHTFCTGQEHGFALWRAIAGEAELLTIAVDPAFQRSGLGAELMTAWMSEARSLASEAFLDVAADNVPALALYAKHGFSQVGQRPGYYPRPPGSAVDALILRAALA